MTKNILFIILVALGLSLIAKSSFAVDRETALKNVCAKVAKSFYFVYEKNCVTISKKYKTPLKNVAACYSFYGEGEHLHCLAHSSHLPLNEVVDCGLKRKGSLKCLANQVKLAKESGLKRKDVAYNLLTIHDVLNCRKSTWLESGARKCMVHRQAELREDLNYEIIKMDRASADGMETDPSVFY